MTKRSDDDIATLDDALAGQTFATREEAIAAALAVVEPGGTLTIHEAHCAMRGEDESACTCTPTDIEAGERAEA